MSSAVRHAHTEPFPVLVVSGGGFQGLAVVRALAAVPNVRIVIADAISNPLTAPLADDIVYVPPVASRRAFEEAVLSLTRRLSARLVIPATERELVSLASITEELEAVGARVAVSCGAALAVFLDRVALHEALRTSALPVLPRLHPCGGDATQLPMLGKPRRQGWGGRGQRLVQTAHELAAIVAAGDADDWLWQPWLSAFREYSVDFAVGFAGDLSPLVARERLRTSGGFCVVAHSTHAPVVLDVAERLASLVAERGGRGFFNAQILESSDGLSISDLNPRVGTSSVFTLGAGVNLAAFLCRSAGASLHDGDAPPLRRVRMSRVLEERFVPEASFAPRALLFDLDDTLLDHKRWILVKLGLLWQSRKTEFPPRESFLRAAWRIIEEESPSHTIDALVRDLGLPTSLRESLIDDYRHIAPASAPLFPDVVGGLAAFRDRGLRLALVTDNPPASQRQKVSAAGLEACFDVVVYTREAGDEKPSPVGLQSALSQLAIAAEDAAMVGDQPLRDGAAALAAGLARFFWVQRGGGLLNIHAGLMETVAPDLARFTVPVRDMRELAEAIRTR